VRLASVAAGYFDPRSDHWKQKKAMGGGAMYDMGVYPLQAARYSTGEEPIAAVAQHFANRPEIYTEVDETTMFQLEFPSGAIAQCTTSFGMGMNHLNVTYERGWAKLEPFSSYSGVGGSASGGRQLEPDPGNQQARQMDNDALAILRDQPVLVSGEEGLRDIRVVEAVYASAKQGGCRISID
jgi:glucose-fructose oxidoreductase